MEPGLSELFRIVNFSLNFSNIARSEGGQRRETREIRRTVSLNRERLCHIPTNTGNMHWSPVPSYPGLMDIYSEDSISDLFLKQIYTGLDW